MRRTDLKPRILDWWKNRRDARPLWSAMRSRVHRFATARNLPPDFFPDRNREPEAEQDGIDMITNDVFVACNSQPIGRAPFYNRPPFQAYLDDDMSEGRIGMLTFTGRHSLTWEAFKRQYARNCTAWPDLARRARTWDEVGTALRRVAQPVDRDERPVRWWVPGLRRVVPAEQVAEDLRRRGLTDIEAILRELLERSGPQTATTLTRLVQDVRGERSHSEVAAEEQRETEDATSIDINYTWNDVEAATWHSANAGHNTWHKREDELTWRREVGGAWLALSPHEQWLLRAIANGLRYHEVMAQRPDQYRNPEAVRYALDRITRVFLHRCASAFGGDLQDKTRLQDLTELIWDVLASMNTEP